MVFEGMSPSDGGDILVKLLSSVGKTEGLF